MTIKNQNNKLNCGMFLHIAPAPAKPLLESSFPFKVIISEASETGPVSLSAINSNTEPPLNFEAEIIDIARIKLVNLSSLITVPASGMDREQFIKHWMIQNPSAGMHDMLAVYIFRKP